MKLYELQIDPERDDQYNVVCRILLDNSDYNIKLRWDTKSLSWMVGLGVSGQNTSFNTVMRTNRDILAPYRYMAGLPQGQLLCIDASGFNGRVGYDDFGIDKRFGLIYVESGDV